MHVLFARIRATGDEQRATLDSLEGPVWDTWAAVEELALRYGVRRTVTPQ
jgi:hypothetical protein